MNSVSKILSFLILAVCTTACAAPGVGVAAGGMHVAVASPSLADGAIVAPPSGFVGFCLHNINQCRAPAQTATSVAWDDHTQALLETVNEQVNKTIHPESDFQKYGVANVWNASAMTDGAGDCKDYALAKREALMAAGIPSGVARIAIVRTMRNELHAVLTVSTDHGDMVLDNMSAFVTPWNETSYQWLSRQSATDPLRWVNLGAAEGRRTMF